MKISPGRQAVYWPECRDGGFIAVGWDEIGDLREFGSKEEFRESYSRAYAAEYNKQPHVISKKANELWRLMELRPGDRVVANKGKSKILAVGTVREPVYEYDARRQTYRHLIWLDWDESYARDIPQQGAWLSTVDKVTLKQRKLIEGGADGDDEAEIDPFYLQLEEALMAKRQVVLYGPPGTGKTFHARRFAAWWLRKNAGDPSAAALLTGEASVDAAERELGGGGIQEQAWLVVASPGENWRWDRLFEDGGVDYEYRRLQRNYPKVRAGDLVFGYESTPTKRLVALARVSRSFGTLEGQSAPTIGLEPLAKLSEGLSYQDLIGDPRLSQSEPVVYGFRGTLFALAPAEAERIWSS